MAYRFDEAFRALVADRLAAHPVDEARRDGLRHAGVAVVIVGDADGRARFVLTRRAARLRAHAAQWALPGGRLEEGESPVDAALRETREEVGLALGSEAVLGRLDDYVTRSGFAISPVVVWGGAEPDYRPNDAEVARVHEFPLAELDRPDSPRFLTIPESDRPVLQVLLHDSKVHAPTGAVLYQFREVALHGRTTRVAHFEQPVFAWK